MAATVLLPFATTAHASLVFSSRDRHARLIYQHSNAFTSFPALRSIRKIKPVVAAGCSGERQRRVQKSQRAYLGLGIGVAFAALVVLCVKKLGSLDAVNTQQVLERSGHGLSFTANVFGWKISLAERTPGWVYFLLLMAAGFGLFISEEALNVWAGASIARCLTWNSSPGLFWASVADNMSYILSTILWVYWGVCISDLVPFYAGKLAAQSSLGSGDDFCTKLGINKEKLDGITKTVQRYGNLIGFVERFSIGARNPTSFLAGASGIPVSKFFAGVCLGGLLTLPIQMSVGFILRERPVAALAGVAAFVGIWTIFPYLVAAALSVFYLTSKNSNNSNQQGATS